MAFQFSEMELIHLLSLKRREAFECIYDQYSAPLYGLILRIAEDEELATEILEMVFLKIFRRRVKYDPADGSFFAWMIIIARNVAIDFMSRHPHQELPQKEHKTITFTQKPKNELKVAWVA